MYYVVDIKFHAWKCLPSSSFDVLRVLAGRGEGVNSHNLLAQTCAGWYFYSLQTFFL